MKRIIAILSGCLILIVSITTVIYLIIQKSGKSSAAHHSSMTIGYYYPESSPVTLAQLATSNYVRNLDILIYYLTSAPDHNGNISISSSKLMDLNAIDLLKRQNYHLKVLFSVGGGKTFSNIAAAPELTRTLVNAIITIIKTYHFDGVDLDWEYPGLPSSPNKDHDKQNFVNLLSKLRQALIQNQEQRQRYILTIAAPPFNNKNWGGAHNIDIPKILANASDHQSVVDYINIMYYDIHGAYNQANNASALAQLSTDPTSNDSVSAGVDDYIHNYTPNLTNAQISHLIIGIPVYGRKWKKVARGTSAAYPYLYQTGIAMPSVTPSYKYLMKNVMPASVGGNGKNYMLISGSVATVPFPAFDYFANQDGDFITADDINTVKAKASYIIAKGLGGAMFWQIAGDTYDRYSLVYNTAKALKKSNTAIPTKPITHIDSNMFTRIINNIIIKFQLLDKY